MRGTSASAARALVAASLAAGSCAGSHVPSTLRPDAEEAITSGYGAYTFLATERGDSEIGELIAIEDERFWLLRNNGKLKAVPLAAVSHGWFGVLKTREDVMVAWTVLGSLSTASHGGFLIFSLPIWLTTGISSSISEANRGVAQYPDLPLSELRAYARFPQGIPPGVDTAQLRTRATSASRPPPAGAAPVPTRKLQPYEPPPPATAPPPPPAADGGAPG